MLRSLPYLHMFSVMYPIMKRLQPTTVFAQYAGTSEQTHEYMGCYTDRTIIFVSHIFRVVFRML